VAMADVLRATAGWAKERRVGSGGYGDVYRGVSPLDGCTLWAVKRARVLTNEFRREIDEMASKHHPHLVRLLGYCVDYDAAADHMEQIAIYEFMPNGDLHHRLHGDGDTGNITPLTLQQRLDILIGVARALEYLHSFGIVHRDIKPANILLDANMQASACADGHAGECMHLWVSHEKPTSHAEPLIRPVLHTSFLSCLNLLSAFYPLSLSLLLRHSLPSCLRPSAHSPVPLPATALPSFGVVMMELLTCKRVVMPCEDGSHIHIKDWVEQQVEGGDIASVVNRGHNAPHAAASKLVEISLSCVAGLVSNRPSMSHVLVQLETLRRGLMGGKQERAARLLDAEVQQASMDSRGLHEELEIINGMSLD
ncbi:unnamed protein product, partial [Closterium sp. NIES-65]